MCLKDPDQYRAYMRSYMALRRAGLPTRSTRASPLFEGRAAHCITCHFCHVRIEGVVHLVGKQKFHPVCRPIYLAKPKPEPRRFPGVWHIGDSFRRAA